VQVCPTVLAPSNGELEGWQRPSTWELVRRSEHTALAAQ
jgi:hypothetical protein